MLDFVEINARKTKFGVEFYPSFKVCYTNQLMIKGSKFHALYDEKTGLWTKDPLAIVDIVDKMTRDYADSYQMPEDMPYYAKKTYKLMKDGDSKLIDKWWHYCEKQMRDYWKPLDASLIFADHKTTINDFATKQLPYVLSDIPTPAYDEMTSVYFTDKEKHKYEWFLGSILTGDSKWIQKFLVFYGEGGTGKGTIIDNVIEPMFTGYYDTFSAMALTSANNMFSLSAFRNSPLVAIDADGDLSRIEDNTKLNSLVSHEYMTVNLKYQSEYTDRFESAIIMGTNKPIRITDAKSGLIRRLIDVTTTGKKIPNRRYHKLIKQLQFEIGGIAYRCKKIYEADPHCYDEYIPTSMLEKTNEFYNFLTDPLIFPKIADADEISLNAAWALYDQYVKDAGLQYKLAKRIFKDELKNYFSEFYPETHRIVEGHRMHVYNMYVGLRHDKLRSMFPDEDFSEIDISTGPIEVSNSWIVLEEQDSVFDKECAGYLAQPAVIEDDGRVIRPEWKWINCKTTVAEIDTRELHYVKVPVNHIVIDFDICDEKGEKNLERNLELASNFPETYCEVSRSGQGLHLHYIWDGDPLQLADHYDDKIEIKVYTGNQTLRRKLSLCNNLPIRHLSSGLPLKEKGGGDTVPDKTLADEKHLRNIIAIALQKKTPKMGCTKREVEWIKKILDEAYDSGMHYDLTDISDDVYGFCANSTNNSDYCLKLFDEMHFRSAAPSADISDEGSDRPLVFFDCEVYSNLFVLVLIPANSDKRIKLINPAPDIVEGLVQSMDLVGFNNWNYDNSILWAWIMHYNNQDLYQLSQDIIGGKFRGFSEAKNVSVTDIYGFAKKKQSLKKWEIEMGIHHQEMGIPWDKPVPKNMVEKVVEYCENDVVATKTLFYHLSGDWEAHKMLVKLATVVGGVPSTVNDSTNTLTRRLIFGDDPNPQEQQVYRNLGVKEKDNMWTVDDWLAGNPKAHVKYGLPYHPGYLYENGVSTYRGVEVGEGGRVYADFEWRSKPAARGTEVKTVPFIGPHIYRHIKVQDVTSMHPFTIIREKLFGPKYTKRFKDLVFARVYIKRHQYDKAAKLFDGALAPFMENITDEQADIIAGALKIAINAVYGQTAAHYINAFRNELNIDNIVAKGGALMMEDLRYALNKRFPDHAVVHIKTDSIKVENTTDEIINFIRSFGDAYGYSFETENEFDRMCLVNNAVYIARREKGTFDPDDPTKEWEATGTQFQIPYVYKTLFTKQDITFDDLCVTQSVTKGSLYLDMNEGLIDVSAEEKKLEDLLKLMSITDSEKQMRAYARFVKKYDETIRNTSNDMEYLKQTLEDYISKGHNYVFVGRVGRFCPMKPGAGGGILYRFDKGKYNAATGSSGFKWMESEVVEQLGKQDLIDYRYFEGLANDAKAAINERGSYDWFISDKDEPERAVKFDFINIPEGVDMEVPFPEENAS